MLKLSNKCGLDELSDEALLLLIKDGNKRAFECIYNRYWKKLFIASYKRIRSEEIAKEILQEIFVGFWCKRSQIEIHKSVYNYLYTALKYSILDYIRASSVRKSYADEILKSASEYDTTTIEQISYNDLANNLEIQISKLTEKCRLIFNMSRKENYSIKEIAQKLNISTKTVENQLHKALKNLRGNLKDEIYLSILLGIVNVIG